MGAVLARLARHERGNALILAAALMMPLVALIGSGVDMGRVYLARSRMQQACDAASLAGRWAVSAGRTTDVVSSEANKFFNFNFPQGTYGTAAFTPSVTTTGGSTKIVSVSARTTLPMSIMSIFGAPSMTVATSCNAQQDFVNTDVVLVLDVTGSMAEKASSSDSQTKIEAMKSAVLSLYDQLAPIQAQLSAAGMRLRFGIVPYSSNVNIGKDLIQTSPEYFRNPFVWLSCDNIYNVYNSTNNCKERKIDWTADMVRDYMGEWRGCIEEPATTPFPASQQAIPAGAYDLAIDHKPVAGTPQERKWNMHLSKTYDFWGKPIGKGVDKLPLDDNGACPYAAARLKTWTRDEISAYLANLVPTGATYHDIGMIWGGRLISSGGVFGDSPATYAGMPVNKFVIFMTDGEMAPQWSLYSAYGVENWDKRVTGGEFGTLTARHSQRFNLACDAVRQKASIWVVSFGTDLDSDLKKCATNPGQASQSNDSNDLIKKFAEIGKNIGALRLTQ